MKSDNNLKKYRNLLMVVVFLAALITGSSFVYQNLFKPAVDEVSTDANNESKKVLIEALNVPAGWWFPAGEAPTSYLVFRDDGILEYPSWFSIRKAPDEYVELRYEYDIRNEVVVISFESHPELFPSRPESFFSDGDRRPTWAKLVAFDREKLEVQLGINKDTVAIVLSGFVFYRVTE